MKYCAIGVSFENQATWSVEVESSDLEADKQSIIHQVYSYTAGPGGAVISNDLDEVLLIDPQGDKQDGSVFIHHWTKANEDF